MAAVWTLCCIRYLLFSACRLLLCCFRGSLKRSARTVQLFGRVAVLPILDPYFEILGAPRGIMVTPSRGFDF